MRVIRGGCRRRSVTGMARVTMWIPDELHNEMRDVIGEDGNVSGYIRQALAAELQLSRLACPQCQRTLDRDWTYCPTCGTTTTLKRDGMDDVASVALGTVRTVFAVVRPRDRCAYASSTDRSVAESYSRETGYEIEEWTETLARWPMEDGSEGFLFWNLRDPRVLSR